MSVSPVSFTSVLSDTSIPLIIGELKPTPAEEWQRMLRFVGWSSQDRMAMSRSLETLFRRGHELVVNTYEHLQHVPETAAVLGWDQGVDPVHLEERRRFFTLWLTRTLGMDTSDEFANYLFRAGKSHAAHGPRHVHVPEAYVTASVGLVLSSFSQYLGEAGMPAEAISAALAGWNKYLGVQLNQMLFGYRIACEFDEGRFKLPVRIFGILRPKVGVAECHIGVSAGATAETVLQKFFNYFPEGRQDALQIIWSSEERPDSLWMDVKPSYRLRKGWRILLNGRELEHQSGLDCLVKQGDELSIFPPGR